jgi:hypothetical protein
MEERMSWTAKRKTTVKEDRVYCLLGIFGVFLPLIYGEGEAYATLRLKDEIRRRHEGRGTASLQDLTGKIAFRDRHHIANDVQSPCHYLFQGMNSSLDEKTSFSILNSFSFPTPTDAQRYMV